MVPGWSGPPAQNRARSSALPGSSTPNLPTNIIPTKIAWLKLSGKYPMCLGSSPLSIQILLESNPLKSIMLVGKLAVARLSSAWKSWMSSWGI